jgi:hypothetical protein
MQKMTNFFMTLEFKILRLIMKNMWWLSFRTTQNTTSKFKNYTIFSLIIREIDAEKTRFQPAKTQKMTNFFMTLEFKIEVIYEEQVMAHIQNHKNTTSKYKNFTIIPLYQWEIDAEKTRFQPTKTQKMTNS